MLLGRTANGLYWMSRYIERAENMARLVDAGLRLALTRTETSADEWHSVVVSAGAEIAFTMRHQVYSADNVADFLLRDTTNPSSVLSSIETARTNARMVRTALTREVWESINEAWMTCRRILASPIDQRELPKILDAVKRETALIRGALHGTMLRNEIFDFAQLGIYVERADNTARILDVKYHVLLPSVADVGGALDYYQWTALLRSVSAFETYRQLFRDQILPIKVAQLLLLERRMPRSLAACLDLIRDSMDRIEGQHDHAAKRLAYELHARLTHADIEEIFQGGLHEYLAACLADIGELGNRIQRAYLGAV